MNHYTLRNSYIVGLDPLDAIKHNVKRIATEHRWNRDTQEEETVIHPADEVYAGWRDGILGGKGGVEIIMRSATDTHTEWMECAKEDWPHGDIKII